MHREQTTTVREKAISISQGNLTIRMITILITIHSSLPQATIHFKYHFCLHHHLHRRHHNRHHPRISNLYKTNIRRQQRLHSTLDRHSFNIYYLRHKSGRHLCILVRALRFIHLVQKMKFYRHQGHKNANTQKLSKCVKSNQMLELTNRLKFYFPVHVLIP